MSERRALTIGLASLLWLVPSLAPIIKLVPAAQSLPVLVVAALSFVAAFIAIAVLSELLKRYETLRGAQWLWAFCAVFAIAFLVLYPLANSGRFGAGADRDDALNVGLRAMMSGHNPYSVMTYLDHRPTPMPGALLMALPFYLLGNAAYQNLVWVPLFAVWASRRCGAGPALWFLLVFMAGSPATLADVMAGGDYTINALYVAIAMSVVVAAYATDSRGKWFASTIVLALAMSSRPIYIMAAPILAGVIYRSRGLATALTFAGVASVACALINGPYFLADPAIFPLRTVADKLGDMPVWWHFEVVLPIIAALIAGASFVVNLAGPRMFVLMAVSLAAMFVPVFVGEWIVGFPGPLLLWVATDALPVSLFAGLALATVLGGAVSPFDRPCLSS